MTKKEFLKAVSNGRIDVLQIFIGTIINLNKDLADILRLIEAYPGLEANLPDSIRKRID